MTSKAPHNRQRNRILSSGERALWRAYTRGVRPIEPERLIAEEPEPEGAAEAPSRPSIKASKAAADQRRIRDQAPSSKTLPTPELAHGQMTDLDRSTAKKFFSGRMGLDGRIDLHGMNKERAHTALNRFILDAHNRGLRAVLVITGKGTRSGGAGVLRREVPMWLNDASLRKCILAFGHAQPGDGGEGALYVLIRRKRP